MNPGGRSNRRDYNSFFSFVSVFILYSWLTNSFQILLYHTEATSFIKLSERTTKVDSKNRNKSLSLLNLNNIACDFMKILNWTVENWIFSKVTFPINWICKEKCNLLNLCQSKWNTILLLIHFKTWNHCTHSMYVVICLQATQVFCIARVANYQFHFDSRIFYKSFSC